MAAATPFDYIAIKETLARYCIAIDGKNFDLREFFTPNVQAKYPGPMFEDVKDVKTLGEAIEKSVSAVTTQHAITTQSIVLAGDGKTATATTYFTCWHFGKDKWEGKHLVAWGRYEDTLVLVSGSGEGVLPGASGRWVVEKREVVITNIDGEMGVMGG